MTDLHQFDTSVPNTARIWNYWLGGKDNFAADREAAERVVEAMPTLPVIARAVPAVPDLWGTPARAADYGVTQFLDIGAGRPAADNTHEVAQRATPSSRIVDVDSYPGGHQPRPGTADQQSRVREIHHIHADMRDTGTILAEAARTLDFSQPVAILLLSVLHFFPDDEDPWAIVAQLMDAVPSGSYLAIVHAASDIQAEGEPEARQRYNQMTPVQFTPRGHAEVARFFDGLEMTSPGLVPMSQWGVSGTEPEAAAEASLAEDCGIGRKP